MDRKRKGWAIRIVKASKAAVNNVKPVTNTENFPRLVNVVATVQLLMPGERTQLNLENVALYTGGMVQYTPLRFAADILRLRDGDSERTALVFRSGKMIVVYCLSWEHARYNCHRFRLLLESLPCVMKDAETGRVCVGNLHGRMSFHNWNVHNNVGSGFLGHRIDLMALLRAAPTICHYEPDRFPGLEIRVWLKPEEECKCSNDSSGKCKCTVNVLIFDTGKVVITGTRTIADLNRVFYRLLHGVADFKDTEAALPRHMRFEARIAALLDHGGLGVARKKNSNRTSEQVIDDTVGQLPQLPAKVEVTAEEKKMPKFLVAALRGQEDAVQWMLEYDPMCATQTDEKGRTALQLLMDMPKEHQTEAHKRIINQLQNF